MQGTENRHFILAGEVWRKARGIVKNCEDKKKTPQLTNCGVRVFKPAYCCWGWAVMDGRSVRGAT